MTSNDMQAIDDIDTDSVSDLDPNDPLALCRFPDRELHSSPPAQGIDMACTLSDLDPNNPNAFLDYLERMGRRSSPEVKTVDVETEYEAEDGHSREGMKAQGVKVVGQNGAMDRERQGKQEKTDQDAMHIDAEDWIVDIGTPSPKVAAVLQRTTITSQESIVERRFHRYLARGSIHGDAPEDGNDSDMPKSDTSMQDWEEVQGSMECFNHFSDSRYYPEAAKFFDLDPVDKGQFRNPFTTPRAGHVRPPTDDVSIPPVSTRCKPEAGEGRPDSRVCEAEGSNAAVVSAQADDSFLELSWVYPGENLFAKSWSKSREPSSFNETFEPNGDGSYAAVYEFLSGIDVEALIADQASSAYVLEDHDTLVDKFRDYTPKPGDMYDESSFDLSPHEPKRGCYCHWCQVHFNGPDCDDDEVHPHDPNSRCHCAACQIFRLKGRVRQIEKHREAQMQDLQAAEETKRTKEESAAAKREELRLLKNEEESRFADILRFRVQQVKAVQEAQEAEESTTWGCMGIFDCI